MYEIGWGFAGFAALATLVHVATIAIAIRRCRHTDAMLPAGEGMPAVSIVRPVHGVEHYDALTLGSTFELDYPNYEILFCVARPDDPAADLVEELVARYPHVQARLLVREDLGSPNPKLNNVAKGWAASASEWIVIADSNVLIPRDYIQRLFLNWGESVGVVCSPPIGAYPDGFWAQIECAFLNTYQARWQYAADTLGYGFCQGKTILWRRSELDAAGGIAALANEIAEDAAATKLVRQAGRRVRLVDRPFVQPLGSRSAGTVWSRQLRWAQLRRQSFPLQFAPEILTGIYSPMLAGLFAAIFFGIPPAPIVGALLLIWLGSEALLANAAHWHLTWRPPITWLARDLMIVAIWFGAWLKRSYDWRGNHVDVLNPKRSRWEAAAGRFVR